MHVLQKVRADLPRRMYRHCRAQSRFRALRGLFRLYRHLPDEGRRIQILIGRSRRTERRFAPAPVFTLCAVRDGCPDARQYSFAQENPPETPDRPQPAGYAARCDRYRSLHSNLYGLPPLRQ